MQARPCEGYSVSKMWNIICVEKKTDVPVGVSQYSISKDLDCQYLYIEFKPTDSNQTVREILYSVKTIQFNPQYSLPSHDHYSAPDIYREYESKGDRPPIDHTLHFYNPHRLITSTSEETICIQLTTNAILPGVIVTNPSPNHKYNTHKHPPITLPQQSPTPQQNLPTPNNIPSTKNLQKPSNRPRSSNVQPIQTLPKGPQGNPQGQANPNPPSESPSPPKSSNESPNPKKPPLPKKSLTLKKEPKDTPQKENLIISNPRGNKKEGVEPRCGNCKRRILNTDDSDDEIGNINENEPETKKVEMRSLVTCFGL